MDVIKTARELGKAIQQDERYLKLASCGQSNDEDQELQDMIGRFNLRRLDLNNEINKDEKDQAKVDEINAEIKDLYAKLMDNPSMTAYQEAKADIDELMEFVMQIIRGSINGEDPDAIEPNQGGCSGSCGSCSGCH